MTDYLDAEKMKELSNDVNTVGEQFMSESQSPLVWFTSTPSTSRTVFHSNFGPIYVEPFEFSSMDWKPWVTLPTKAHDGDLGYDLYSSESAWILPFQRKLISTGLKFNINGSFGGLIRDRSSMAWKRGLFVFAGVIDSGYRGEIKVLLYNSTLLPKKIDIGDKIAQMLIVPVINGDVKWGSTNESDETTRGAMGFGSTGR